MHESNAVPGLTTQRLAKVADRVMVGYEDSRQHYHHPDRVVVTGTPVRGEFFRLTRQQAGTPWASGMTGPWSCPIGAAWGRR